MKHPTREQIVEWLFESYTLADAKSLPGICHCLNVGLAMEAIAKRSKIIDPYDAKIIGFLHDVGKRDIFTNPQYIGKKRAHDITGYEFLLNQGFSDLAVASLTHSLLSENMDTDYNQAMFFYNKQDIIKVKKFLKENHLTKLHQLLQMCDWIIQKDHVCTIENSYNFIKNYYGNYKGLDECFRQAKSIKKEFDDLCDKDIYEISDEVIIKNWDLSNLRQFIKKIICFNC